MADRTNVGVRVPGVGDRWDPLENIVTEPGPYVGKGPRDSQRADERIHDDVCLALQRSGEVDASGIEVVVTDGEVYLLGLIPDREQKKLAERVVEMVTGVRDIHNRLERVKGGPPIDPATADISTDSTVDGSTRESGTGHIGVTS